MDRESEANVWLQREGVKRIRDGAKAYTRQLNNLKISGGDASRGHTRSHPEHDG